MQSSSTVSDASEVRYQKAVKQISKLIGVNNNLKRDAENFRILCENLQQQNTQLYKTLEEVSNQKQALEERISVYQNEISQVKQTNQNLMKKQQSLFTNSMVQKQRKKHEEQIILLKQKLNEQGNTIMHLQERVPQIQKQNKDLKENVQRLQSQLLKELQLKNKRISYGDCLKCPQNLKKAEQAKQFNKFIQNQYVSLKKRVMELSKPEPIHLYHKNGQAKQHLIASLQEKVRIVEEKYKRKKIEVYKLETKAQKLEQQLKTLRQKLKIFDTTNTYCHN